MYWYLSMTKNINPIVPADEELLPAKTTPQTDGNYQPKPKRPYDKLLTDLSEEDLKSPGVYKLILAKNSELEYENYELKKKDSEHRKLEAEHASAKADLHHLKTTKKSIEFLFSVCLGAGTCLVGLSLSIKSTDSLVGGIAVGGIGLVLAAIAIVVAFRENKGRDNEGEGK